MPGMSGFGNHQDNGQQLDVYVVVCCTRLFKSYRRLDTARIMHSRAIFYYYYYSQLQLLCPELVRFGNRRNSGAVVEWMPTAMLVQFAK